MVVINMKVYTEQAVFSYPGNMVVEFGQLRQRIKSSE